MVSRKGGLTDTRPSTPPGEARPPPQETLDLSTPGALGGRGRGGRPSCRPTPRGQSWSRRRRHRVADRPSPSRCRRATTMERGTPPPHARRKAAPELPRRLRGVCCAASEPEIRHGGSDPVKGGPELAMARPAHGGRRCSKGVGEGVERERGRENGDPLLAATAARKSGGGGPVGEEGRWPVETMRGRCIAFWWQVYV